MQVPTSTLGQSLCFSALVLILALANSFLNPRALDLTRDYFPQAQSAALTSSKPSSSALPKHDFGVMTAEDILEFLPDFKKEDHMVICLDARSPSHYRNGHIPGAYLLDHYHQDDYLPQLVPMLKQAGYVIVYCKGGDCEDSIFLATDLVYHQGIEKEVVYIYEGGFHEWREKGLPITEGMEP